MAEIQQISCRMCSIGMTRLARKEEEEVSGAMRTKPTC